MTVDEEKKTKTNLTKVLRKYTDFAISIFFITIFTGYMRRKDSYVEVKNMSQRSGIEY